ncbi:DUF1189 domain-containing protein [Enterococcus bulliens]
MSMFQLIRSSFFQFQALNRVKQVPFGKIVVYLLCLSFIFAIPMTFQVVEVFQAIRADGQEIAKNLPDFSIKDGELATDDATKGFIYQTDSIIFTFDPENQRSLTEITQEDLGNLFNIGLLKNEAVLAIPQGEFSSTLSANPIVIPYTSAIFTGFTGTALKNGLAHNQVPWFVYVIIFLIAMYPSFLTLVVTLVISSLAFSIFLRARSPQWRFLNTLKTLIVCSTVPTLLAAIILFLNIDFDTTTFIFLATSFLFINVIRQEKKERV